MPSPLTGWNEESNTQMGAVCYAGVNSCNPIIYAYNSGCLDTLRNRLICFGGGHGDYGGNDVYGLGMNGTFAWAGIHTNINPSACGSYTCDGGVSPNSRHTYGGICYMPNIDRFMICGGALAPGGNFAQDTWTYDCATNIWHYENATGLNFFGAGAIIAWHEASQKVYLKTSGELYSYNYSTKVWTKLKQLSGGDYHLYGVIDQARNIFMAFGANEEHFVSLDSPYQEWNSGVFPSFVTTGDHTGIAAGDPGIAYDSVNDQIVLWAGGGDIYKLALATWVWTKVTFTGGPGAVASSGTRGHFQYIPSLNLFTLVNSASQNVFTVRTNSGAVDNTPPTTPSSLTATATSAFSVALSWTASTDANGVVGYRIERCQGASCGGFVQIDTAGGTTYTDNTTSGSQLYRYRVRAFDSSLNYSSYSNIAEATTPVAPPNWVGEYWNSGSGSAPSFPGGSPDLTRSDVDINFHWGGGSPSPGVINTDHFMVRWTRTFTFTAGDYLFSTASDDGMRVYVDAVLVSGLNHWVDQGLTAYQAVVTLGAGDHTLIVEYYENGGGADAVFSYALQAAADTEAPTAPTNVTLSVISSSRIDLVWTASTDNVGVTGYSLERCSGAACSGFAVVATPAGTSYSDTSLSGATLYRYRARARDAAGNYSAYSTIVEATTDPSPSGVIHVGSARTYTTVLAGYNAAVPGDTIEIDPEVFHNDVVSVLKANLIFRGVGGSAILGTAAHLKWDTGDFRTGTTTIPNGQGILKILAPGVLIDNIEFSGARVDDENGAAVRYATNGNLDITNCHIHDCEEGFLGGPADGASTLTMDFNRIHGNGNISGPCHNVYVGSMGRLLFRHNWSYDPEQGHCVKSRALYNEVAYNFLSTKNSDGSFEADFPDGGIVIFDGNVVEQGVDTSNSTMLSFALEIGNNTLQHELYVVNNTFYNFRGSGTFVQKNAAITLDAPLAIRNNIFANGGTILSGDTTDLSSNLTPSDASFVDWVNSDFHIVNGSPVIDVGVSPGSTLAGFNLTPVWMYVSPASRTPRTINGTAIDVGAYENQATPVQIVKKVPFSRAT